MNNHVDARRRNEPAERLGRNEALFREVNEAIARGLWPGEESLLVPSGLCHRREA